MEQAIWLSALGAGLALDNAMIGQFMLAQPLVVGSLFGMLLGDLPAGLMVGAMVQLIWIGDLPVGAYVPSDHTVTAGITSGVAIMFMRESGLAFGPSLVLSLTVAIPAGFLSGKLDILVRHVNSHISSLGERLLERYGPQAIDGLNLSGLIAAFLRNYIIYFLWLGPLAVFFKLMTTKLPEPVIRGMGIVYWVLPMLSFAAVLEIIAKEKSLWWAGVAFILAMLLMLLASEYALAIFVGILTLGAILVWWRRT